MRTCTFRSQNSACVNRRACCARIPNRSRTVARAIVDDDEIDDKVADFLRQQDMSERGLEARPDPTKVIGDDEVSEEQAKAYCRDIVRVLRMLKEKRDMEVREAKLVIAIDDPKNDDARKMGIEDSAGVSRDEMALALEDVSAGKIPTDRIALRVLHAEMTNWPFLENDATPTAKPAVLEAAPSISGSNDAESAEASAPGWRPGQARPPVGRDPNEKREGLAGALPDWMGYGAVYFVTIIPALILGTTVAILFFSSLK